MQNGTHSDYSLHDVDDLHELSEILNNCEIYDIKRFNYLSNSLHTADNINFSCLCNNIDGNASNFDQFTSVILGQMKNCFSVIALTETNIDICHKNLYNLPNYTSEHNEKFSGKHKGTGIGLYIHNEFIFNRINKFSHCTKNMESLFVTIANTNVPITVDVVYRPPSGSIKNFINEWEAILKQLPEKNVVIIGDFNIDLLQPNTDFEGVLYSNNFIPIIALVTDEKSGCKPSLIINIFINSSNSIQNAEIIESKVSHHSPVFCFLNYENASGEEAVSKCPKYDYCETNMNNFLSKFIIYLSEKYDPYNETTFIKFVKQFKECFDECFRVEEHNFKKSRRNFYVNPWATPGIRACISKKNYMYKLWKQNEKLKNRDQKATNVYCEKYKCYRRYPKENHQAG